MATLLVATPPIHATRVAHTRPVKYVFAVSFLPPIDISTRIQRLDMVDTQKNAFATTFSVMLDWEVHR